MSTKKECLTFWKNVLQAEPDVCGRRHPYDQETLIHKLVRLDKRKSLKAFVRGLQEVRIHIKLTSTSSSHTQVRGLFFTPTQIVGLREIVEQQENEERYGQKSTRIEIAVVLGCGLMTFFQIS